MREPLFLRQNKDKWREYQETLFDANPEQSNPDRLAELYIQLTDDLGYARTFYPRSQSVKYLNGLAARTHLSIYQNKKEKKGRFLDFFSVELPLIFKRTHKYMLYSLIIFLASAGMGWLSATNEPAIVTEYFGSDYVNMTIENIKAGDPTGVYSRESEFDMFLFIALNNLKVAFLTFAMGIFFSVGAAWHMFNNGFMVGTFFGFLKDYDVLGQSFPVVMLHGALELSAIAIAGGAGFLLGNSFMFPGTYTRIQSLQRGAKDGLKIMIGLTPVIVLAAFIESYITRHADMPDWIKWLIIGLSFAYILWYYVLYPLTIKTIQDGENRTT